VALNPSYAWLRYQGFVTISGFALNAAMSRLLNVMLPSAYAVGALSLVDRWSHPS
jgi:hypothetical protein